MRLQIVDLPSKFAGSAQESHPYLLVLSEVPDYVAANVEMHRSASVIKDSFDDCAGVLITQEPVELGAETTLADVTGAWAEIADQQTPEEIAADVAAVVQEQRELRKDGY